MSQQQEPITRDQSPVEASSTTPQVASTQLNGDSRPKGTLWHKAYECFTYVPPRCRYDPEKPFQFSMGLNLLFGRSQQTIARLIMRLTINHKHLLDVSPWPTYTTPTQSSTSWPETSMSPTNGPRSSQPSHKLAMRVAFCSFAPWEI